MEVTIRRTKETTEIDVSDGNYSVNHIKRFLEIKFEEVNFKWESPDNVENYTLIASTRNASVGSNTLVIPGEEVFIGDLDTPEKVVSLIEHTTAKVQDFLNPVWEIKRKF